MKNYLLKTSSFCLLALLTLLTACNKEETVTEDAVVEFTEQAVYRMQETTNAGKFGCYEFVFPIGISFSDGTSLSVDSYEALKDAIQAWKEANPDATEHPMLDFPIEVTSDEGELITVNDFSELKELRSDCKKGHFAKRGFKGCRGKGDKCFSLVFPLTIVFPDDTTAEADSRATLKTLVREWKVNNEDSTERPTIQFPIEVTMEDETVVSVASKEELKALKDSCVD